MGFIVKHIPFANGIFANQNSNASKFDYIAYFEESEAGRLKEEYSSPKEAYRDGCKFIYQYRDGINIFHIIEGVNPEMVRKLWTFPKNKDESDSVYINYIYTSESKQKALNWFAKNLPFLSSRYGLNVNLIKINSDRINEPQ